MISREGNAAGTAGDQTGNAVAAYQARRDNISRERNNEFIL